MNDEKSNCSWKYCGFKNINRKWKELEIDFCKKPIRFNQNKEVDQLIKTVKGKVKKEAVATKRNIIKNGKIINQRKLFLTN
jgi:hypothetical protein